MATVVRVTSRDSNPIQEYEYSKLQNRNELVVTGSLPVADRALSFAKHVLQHISIEGCNAKDSCQQGHRLESLESPQTFVCCSRAASKEMGTLKCTCRQCAYDSCASCNPIQAKLHLEKELDLLEQLKVTVSHKQRSWCSCCRSSTSCNANRQGVWPGDFGENDHAVVAARALRIVDHALRMPLRDHNVDVDMLTAELAFLHLAQVNSTNIFSDKLYMNCGPTTSCNGSPVWQSFRNLQLVKAAMILAERLPFLADIGLDIWVTWRLAQCKDAVHFAFLSACFIAAPLVLMQESLRWYVVQRKWLRDHSLNRVAVHIVWACIGWMVIVAWDLRVFGRHLVSNPNTAENFHYMNLRKLSEKLIEAPLQTGLQCILLVRTLMADNDTTCVGRINPWMLGLSIAFSLKAVLDCLAFLTKFSALQTNGNVWRLLCRMARLGQGMAPSSLLADLQESVQVKCTYNLCLLDLSGFQSFCQAIEASKTLESLTLSDTPWTTFKTMLPGVMWIFTTALKHNQSLKYLELENCPAILFPAMKDVLKNHATLQEVSLGLGQTPLAPEDGAASRLEQAVLDGNLHVVRELSQDRSKLEQKTLTGPLLAASKLGNLKATVLLLLAGAAPNDVCTETDYFPLLEAAHRGHFHVANALLNALADVNQIHAKHGNFPLLLAVKNKDCRTMLHTLLLARADVCQRNPMNGNSVLMWAAFLGKLDAIHVLFEHKSDLLSERQNSVNGAFPLQYAALGNHVDVAQALLQAAADIHEKNALTGKDALLYASEQGCTETVELLLRARADVDRCSACSQTFTAEARQEKIAKHQMGTRDASTTGDFPLLAASRGGHGDAMEALIRAAADLQQTDEDGNSPLLEAARHGHCDAVEILLEARADQHRIQTLTGDFPLQVARRAGHEEVVKVLAANSHLQDASRLSL